ncbi:hypothetical protein ALC53_12443 [Atta colombica]|uniref:Prolyl 4-hydroxylase N-terminal domain-containing protein n=1 Tax=Atta colombica TaxID=520822 RepID=A0A195AY23_9HYME|nr:hypothetical protein ALC53_12443 [Atta colombica]
METTKSRRRLPGLSVMEQISHRRRRATLNGAGRNTLKLYPYRSEMRKATLLAVVTILLSTTARDAVAELYTALADMEELLETEAVLIDTLNGYITAQEQRLATLRR